MPAGMIERRPVHHRPGRIIQRQHRAVQRQIFRPAGAVRLRHLQQSVAIGPQPLEMFFRRLQAEIFPLNHVPLMFLCRGSVKLIPETKTARQAQGQAGCSSRRSQAGWGARAEATRWQGYSIPPCGASFSGRTHEPSREDNNPCSFFTTELCLNLGDGAK
jgi:hypothetical protein